MVLFDKIHNLDKKVKNFFLKFNFDNSLYLYLREFIKDLEFSEFKNLWGSEFVDYCFERIHHRKPKKNELNTFIGQLNRGISKIAILYEISKIDNKVGEFEKIQGAKRKLNTQKSIYYMPFLGNILKNIGIRVDLETVDARQQRIILNKLFETSCKKNMETVEKIHDEYKEIKSNYGVNTMLVLEYFKSSL